MPSIIMALHRKFRPYNIFGTHFKICAEQVESQVYEIEKKILDRREQRMAMLNTASNGRATP